MSMTRRETLQMAALSGLTVIMPFAARAQAAGDVYKTDSGEITVNPVQHASLVLNTPGAVVYADPVGEPALYAAFAPADLILITHEHGDHMDIKLVSQLAARPEARLVVNPAVFDKLPDELKAKSTALKNGDKTTVGAIGIEAVPAYNITEERKKFHPQGRDNGYVLSIDGKRVYIAGDTEDTPELRALTGIDIAFLPMNLPYTMDVDHAAEAVAAFRPAVVYPYHYRGEAGLSDIDAFAAKVGDASRVVKGKWYS